MNLSIKKIYICFLFIFFTRVHPVFATTYNVTPSTISNVLSNLQPGDVVNMSYARYPSLTVSKSGTASAPITINGNNAIISGGATGLNLSGSYLNVNGVEETGAVDHGIHITGKNVTLSNFKIHDSVTRNKKYNSSGVFIGCGAQGSGGWGSGLSIKYGSENVNVSDGLIYNNCGEGMAATRTIGAMVKKVTSHDNYSGNLYVDNSENVTLDGNFAYGTGNVLFYRSGVPAPGILIGEEYYDNPAPWGKRLKNITIINNIIYNCSGIKYWGASADFGTFTGNGLKGAKIFHNTLNAITGPSSINIGTYNSPNNSGIEIKNNIAQRSISSASYITASNNISSATFQTSQGYDPNSFKLAAGSAVINAGVNVGVAKDYYGNARDANPDIGAHEYNGSVPSLSPSASPPKPGDANGDGEVDGIDYIVWLNHYNQSVFGAGNGDFNNSGKVDGVDHIIWLNNYEK